MSGYFLRLLARAAAGDAAEVAVVSEPVADAVLGEHAPMRAIDEGAFEAKFAATPSGAPRPVAGVGVTTAQGNGVAAPRVSTPLTEQLAPDRPLDPKALRPLAVAPTETAPIVTARRGPIARPDREPASPTAPRSPVVIRAQATPDPAIPAVPTGTSDIARDGRPPERVKLPDALLMPAVARAEPIALSASALVASPPAVVPDAADPTPAVHISIGRIDVIASPPQTMASPAPPTATAHAPQSLDAYLARRAHAR